MGRLLLLALLMGGSFGVLAQTPSLSVEKAAKPALLEPSAVGGQGLVPFASSPGGGAVSERDVRRSIIAQFGEDIFEETLDIHYADVTCDGAVDGVVGYISLHHPEMMYYSLLLVTRTRGELENTLMFFDFDAAGDPAFCGPPRAMPDLAVHPLSQAEAQRGVDDDYPVCSTGIRLSEAAQKDIPPGPNCPATFWAFHVPGLDTEDPAFVLGIKSPVPPR